MTEVDEPFVFAGQEMPVHIEREGGGVMSHLRLDELEIETAGDETRKRSRGEAT